MAHSGPAAATTVARAFAFGVAAALSFTTAGITSFAASAPSGRAAELAAIRAEHLDSAGLNQRKAAAAAAGSSLAQRLTPKTSPPCDSTFHQTATANPSVANTVLNNALTAVSATDIWGAGAQAVTSTSPDSPLVERFDGSQWSSVGVPVTGAGNNDFWGISSVPGATGDANNIWAFGNYTDITGVEHAQAAEYTGGATNGGWTFFTPSNLTPGTGNNLLHQGAAITATNIWAVGDWRTDNNSGTPYQPLIGHWDGASFTTAAGPRVSSTSSDALLAASASGASDVWAVGRSTDSSGNESTLIEHYDGSSWTVTPSVSPGALGNTLYSVSAVSSTLAYAAGNYIDVNGYSHTLVEKWNGAAWSYIVTPDVNPGIADNFLFSVSALSATNIWAAGSVNAHNNSGSPADTLVEHFDGTSWKLVPSVDGAPGNFNEINAILAQSATNIWAAGDYVNGSGSSATLDVLAENLCIGLPTVSSVQPISGNTGGGTQVLISGSNFNFTTAVAFGSTVLSPSSYTIDSNTSITATTPSSASSGTVDVTVTNPAGSSATTTADTFVYVPPAVSWQQYLLNGNDGTTWQPIDATNLSVTFNGSANFDAVLSGNADLWTTAAGVNQDLGIKVTGGSFGTAGQIVGWKESGGFAGTFSPNAAFVQSMIPVAASTTYTATLMWKTNKSTSATIVAAAGNGPAFSPTKLTVQLIPATPNLQSVSSNKQYLMNSNDGISWQDVDATNLSILNFTPATNGTAVLSGNADLWTTKAGINQDLGILVSGPGMGLNGRVAGWKESGGFAGTFSPNAAFVQTTVQLNAGMTYSMKLQWKANKAMTSTIAIGAGPWPGNTTSFSPTRLTMNFYPGGTGAFDAASTSQYQRTGSTGSDWQPIDATNLKIQITPNANSLFVLSANADLWTATAGVNQDIGIFVSGGAYGSGTLVAWKESGGFAGTFSPNAAFVQTVLPLASSVTYTIMPEWKANKATNGTIFIGAGPWPSGTNTFSPTHITAEQTN